MLDAQKYAAMHFISEFLDWLNGCLCQLKEKGNNHYVFYIHIK